MTFLALPLGGVGGGLGLHQLHLIYILLLLAVVALEDAVFLIHHVEERVHRLVVGDALRVVASYDTPKFIRCDDGFLLHHFVVLNDVEHDIGGKHRES